MGKKNHEIVPPIRVFLHILPIIQEHGTISNSRELLDHYAVLNDAQWLESELMKHWSGTVLVRIHLCADGRIIFVNGVRLVHSFSRSPRKYMLWSYDPAQGDIVQVSEWGEYHNIESAQRAADNYVNTINRRILS